MFEFSTVVEKMGYLGGFFFISLLGFLAGAIGHFLNKAEKKVKDGWRGSIEPLPPFLLKKNKNFGRIQAIVNGD